MCWLAVLGGGLAIWRGRLWVFWQQPQLRAQLPDTGVNGPAAVPAPASQVMPAFESACEALRQHGETGARHALLQFLTHRIHECNNKWSHVLGVTG